MRPLLVLLLVAAAIGGLFLAIHSLGGNGTDLDAPTPVGVAPREAGTTATESLPPVPDRSGPRAELTEAGGRTRDQRVSAAASGYENELRGSVRGPEGEPVAGATVRLSRGGSAAMLFVNEPRDTSKDIVVRTDEEGGFRFVGIEPYDHYSLIVDHPNYTRKEVETVQIGPQGVFVEPPIQLGQGAQLKGYVKDTGGNMVPGAKCVLDTMFAGLDTQPSPDAMVTETNSSGFYEFKNIPRGHRTLTVSADGYGNVIVTGLSFSGTEEVTRDVTLEVAEMICGRVVDDAGNPVAGANVIALSYASGTRQCRSTAVSDQDGRFCVENLNAGQYTVACNAEGYQPARALRVSTGDSSVLLQVHQRATVSGQVLDAASGDPVRRFTCRLRVAYEGTEVTQPTNTLQSFESENGEFTLGNVAPGSYVIEASAPGYAPTFSERFRITQGQSIAGIVIRISKGGSIEGVVLGSAGEPISGAIVSTHDNTWTDDLFTRALGAEFPTNATSRETRTVGDGTFRLENLRPETYQIRVRDGAHVELVVQDVLVRDGDVTDLGELRLSEGGTLVGTVLDQAGQPVAGAPIRLIPDGRRQGLPKTYSGKSGEDGKYRIAHIEPGSYRVSATSPGAGGDFLGLVDQKSSERTVSIVEGKELRIDLKIGG